MTDQTTPVSPWKTRWGLIIAAILVFVMNFYVSMSQRPTYSNGTPEGDGYFYGQLVGMVLAAAFLLPTIAWALIYFISIRPSGRRVGTKYFWILVIVGALPALVRAAMFLAVGP